NSYLALKNVRCDFHEGVLTLKGCLPTYYLKQMAQSVVGRIEGVQRIVNEIQVVASAARGGRARGASKGLLSGTRRGRGSARGETSFRYPGHSTAALRAPQGAGMPPTPPLRLRSHGCPAGRALPHSPGSVTARVRSRPGREGTSWRDSGALAGAAAA